MTDTTPIRAAVDPTPANNPPRSLRAAVAERSDFPDVMIHEWTVLKLCSGDAPLDAEEIKYLVDEFFSPPLTMLDLADLVDGMVGKNWLAWDDDNMKLHATVTGSEILARIGRSFRLADFSADLVSMAKRRPDR
jgi:hypothetical protein